VANFAVESRLVACQGFASGVGFSQSDGLGAVGWRLRVAARPTICSGRNGECDLNYKRRWRYSTGCARPGRTRGKPTRYLYPDVVFCPDPAEGAPTKVHASPLESGTTGVAADSRVFRCRRFVENLGAYRPTAVLSPPVRFGSRAPDFPTAVFYAAVVRERSGALADGWSGYLRC